MKDNDQICLTIGEIRAFISMLPGNILLQKLRVVSYDKKSFIRLTHQLFTNSEFYLDFHTARKTLGKLAHLHKENVYFSDLKWPILLSMIVVFLILIIIISYSKNTFEKSTCLHFFHLKIV